MYFRYLPAILTLFSITFFLACGRSVSLDKEKSIIKERIGLIAKAHLEKDATLFYTPYDRSWYDAREGKITQRFRDSSIRGTQDYLDQMEFIELQPSHEPIIEISDDGTMASYMGAVVVKGKYNSQPVFWVVSWMSVLKKLEGEWQIISNANTQATPAATAEMLLEKVGEVMGTLTTEDLIYARAACNGPGGAFSTLVLSGQDNARMEQSSSDYHIILKQGTTNSWSTDVRTGKTNDTMDAATENFVMGHELHWLSFRPLDRFSNGIFIGFDTYNDRDAFKVRFSDALDRAVYFYYDFENYLPLGFNIATFSEEQRVNVFFDDWRDLGGLKVFYKAKFEDGDQLFEYSYEQLEVSDKRQFDMEARHALIE